MAMTHRLHRRHRPRHRLLRHRRMADCYVNINQIDPALARQLYPLGSGWDAAKLRESIPNPFFGIAAAGELGTQRDRFARPAAAAVSGVRRHPRARVDRRLEAAIPRRGVQAGEAAERRAELVGRPFQLHLEPTRRTTSSARPTPTRGAPRLPQNNYDLEAEYSHQHLRLAAPDRAGADRPTARPDRPQRPAPTRWLGGWNASRDRRLRKRLAAERGAQRRHVGRQPRSLRRPAAAEPDRATRTRRAATTIASRSADQSRRAVLQRGGVRQPGRRTVRQRAADQSTTPRNRFRKNIDLVFARTRSSAADRSGEIRFEILNLTNTAKFGNEVDQQRHQHVEFRAASRRQAGFMRISQLTFRYRF